MSVEFDIRPSVQKNTELPFARLTVVRSLSELHLPDIRVGILFVFAAWSSPAITALSRLTRVLSTLDLGSLEVIILDIDSMTSEDMVQLFGHVFHGAGETLWIRGGKIVAELSAFPPEAESLMLSHTSELL